MIKIFCVEDNPLFGKMLVHRLSMDAEYKVKLFETGTLFLDALKERPNIVTLDIHLPDIDGLEVMKEIKRSLPDTEVIILSGQNNVEVATRLFSLGAYDYVYKDETALERLWKVIHNASAGIDLKQEVRHLKTAVAQKYGLKTDLKGSSDELNAVFSKVSKALNNRVNVMVTGETGTGKELVAKTIHFNSDRSSMPFVAVNVTAIPRELIESELFGHEKGAFTGATSARVGLLESAKGGTLFLDEIGEMDLPMQAKLLRVLQEMKVSRVGSNEEIKLDFRLIIATHRSLFEEVKENRFREDLYYRLLGITIELPPLRNRGKDILVLANYFLDQFCSSNNIANKRLSQQASRSLLTYSFPGNVRELRAMMETAAVMSEADLIELEDLNFRAELESSKDSASGMTLEEHVNRIIERALKENKNNVVKTAKILDVGKSTIYRLIKEGKVNKN